MAETEQIEISTHRPIAAGEAWRKSAGSARALRYVSLLYTAFFFIEPYYEHSRTHWLWFIAFYATFLLLYFAIAKTEGRTQGVLFGFLFALSFAYFPYNESASGAFVYPVVMLAFVLRSTRIYIGVVAFAVIGIMLETWTFHLHLWAGGMGAFFCIVIGFSNLAYSRQQQASFMLQRANEEIEHLAQVAERERIARDLHDLLGHTLTVITIKSELANRLIDIDPQRARQEMLDVEQTARTALADVREAVAGYRSEGLAAEISRARRTLLSAEVTLSTSIAVVELTPGDINILCLCLREAVTNIVRHAHATTCDVQLVTTNEGLRLSIEDNGIGSTGKEGNGLRGMRERVASTQGKLRFTSTPESGTHLIVTLPSSNCATRALQLQQDANA
jgi:two-component system sensor histidine kinase DesK